ncbi:MAG TPA: hypothetical protein VMX13_03365, partial [Sedimentisphaerales bacterium]|nr:hypothetical protein [Sedimentisphaerales bacterium]
MIFQIAEVLVSERLFQEILERTHRLKPVPIGYGWILHIYAGTHGDFAPAFTHPCFAVSADVFAEQPQGSFYLSAGNLVAGDRLVA